MRLREGLHAGGNSGALEMFGVPQEIQCHVSGTIFHSRKLAIRDYLAVIALFCNGVKGTPALQMARDMNINPKSAFVLLHKLREAMGAEIAAGAELLGEVEVDGAYFGRSDRRRTGSPIVANSAAKAANNKSWLSLASVVAMRGRGLSAEKSMPSRLCVTPLRADRPCTRMNRTPGTSCTHRFLPNASITLSSSSAKTALAPTKPKSFFARLRRSEFGIHHRIAGRHLLAYSHECAWRENHRREVQRHPLEPDYRRCPGASEVGDLDRLLASRKGSRMSQNNEAITITANALVKKRTDLLFEISQREREIQRLQTELVHVDAVLRMFRPDFKAEALPVRHRRPTKSPYFRHGELTQRIYDTLRQRGKISSADVAVQAMRDKGLDPTTIRSRAPTSCAASGCNSMRYSATAKSSGSARGRCCDGD